MKAICAICGALLAWDDWKGNSWTGAWVDARGVEHPIAKLIRQSTARA